MHRLLVSFVSLLSVVASSQPVSIDYDTFCAQSEQERIRTFNIVTPEIRAELVRTRIVRWLDANSARLSTEQVAMMRENVAFVTADAYRKETRSAFQERAKELEQRTAALFTREEMRQALTIHGDCR